MLKGIRDVLEIGGYEVIPAVDGMQALARMERHQPDLIVADIMMPRMDGYELLSAVRANPKWLRIPFIFLTAKDQRIDVRFGKRLGAEDYLTKPFEPADLLVAVGAKVERAAALEDLGLPLSRLQPAHLAEPRNALLECRIVKRDSTDAAGFAVQTTGGNPFVRHPCTSDTTLAHPIDAAPKSV